MIFLNPKPVYAGFVVDNVALKQVLGVLRKASNSFVIFPSVCLSACISATPTREIFYFYISVY
jgi:hypothetical protein